MKCETCGAMLAEGAYFCPECGSLVRSNTNDKNNANTQDGIQTSTNSPETQTRTDSGQCTKCGAELKPGEKFCSACGHKAENIIVDGGTKYRDKHKNTGAITVIIVAAVSLAACAISMAMILSHSDTLRMLLAQKPTQSPTPTATVLPTPTAYQAGTPVYSFKLGSYSSEHRNSSDGVSSDTYYANHIIDGDSRTAWIPVCEDDGLSPIGHWIELVSSTPQYVSGLKVVNGFAKDDRKYRNNYRVKDIRIVINNSEEIVRQLSDAGCGIEEEISFGRVYQASIIKIIIESVYDTHPIYNEAAISEITPIS